MVPRALPGDGIAPKRKVVTAEDIEPLFDDVFAKWPQLFEELAEAVIPGYARHCPWADRHLVRVFREPDSGGSGRPGVFSLSSRCRHPVRNESTGELYHPHVTCTLQIELPARGDVNDIIARHLSLTSPTHTIPPATEAEIDYARRNNKTLLEADALSRLLLQPDMRLLFEVLAKAYVPAYHLGCPNFLRHRVEAAVLYGQKSRSYTYAIKSECSFGHCCAARECTIKFSLPVTLYANDVLGCYLENAQPVPVPQEPPAAGKRTKK